MARATTAITASHGATGSPTRLAALVQLIRPHEWVKNLFVFAPLIFSGNLVHLEPAIRTGVLWLIFCGATSFSYVLNDILDREHDAHHPTKSARSIPSGRVSVRQATFLAVGLLIGTELAAMTQPALVALLINCYLLTAVLYSTYLKRKVILDVLTIAVGFVLRILAGAAVIAVGASKWLILCAFLLASFLGFSKRRHELVELGEHASEHRWVLRFYSTPFLDQMNLIAITLTLTCYIFYTIAPETIARFETRHLLYSVLLVMLGLFRYLFLIHHKQQGSPVTVLYTDRQIVLIVFAWVLYMVWWIYAWPAVKPWVLS